MNKDEEEHGKERTAKVYRRIRVSLVAQIPPMPDASIRAFLRPTKSRSPQFAETGQEMEIFIPAVEKRSAIDAITRLIAFLLPMAHAVARALSLSISFHLLLPSAHCLPALYPPSFHFLFLPLAQPQYVCLPIPHPSYETHKSPISFYFSLSLSLSLSAPHLHPSIHSPGYTGRPSSPWPPSPSPFFGALPTRSLASAGNSAQRSPRRIAREHGIPPFLQCPVILKNTPAK